MKTEFKKIPLFVFYFVNLTYLIKLNIYHYFDICVFLEYMVKSPKILKRFTIFFLIFQKDDIIFLIFTFEVHLYIHINVQLKQMIILKFII